MPTDDKWAETTVGSVVSLEYGKGLLAESRTGSGFPVFGSSGEVGRHAVPLVDGPGIVVGRKGTVGSIVWSDQPFWPIDTTYYVQRLRTVDLRWLFWRLSTLDLGRLDSSTGVPGLNRNDVYRMAVWLPSEAEQRRIAAILDTLDDAIRRTEQVIAKLQQMKQGLLHDLLTRGVNEHGELPDPVRAPTAFVETELGVLPRHWQLGGFALFPAADRQLIKTGPFGTAMKGRRWADTGVPVITIGSLGEQAVIRENLLFLGPTDAKAFSSYALEAGDLVFSRVADLGRSLVIGDEERGWIMSSNLMRISLDRNRVVPDYVHLAILYGGSSRRQIRRLANAGAREVANTAVLNRLKFAWPPREEQSRICDIVAAHDAQQTKYLEVSQKLTVLKHGLLHDLLTGRVRVPVSAEVSP